MQYVRIILALVTPLDKTCIRTPGLANASCSQKAQIMFIVKVRTLILPTPTNYIPVKIISNAA